MLGWQVFVLMGCQCIFRYTNFGKDRTFNSVSGIKITSRGFNYRKVFNMKPQDLPSADRVEEKSIFCQPCKRNEEFRKAAVYCVKCEAKFCVSHQKVDLLFNQWDKYSLCHVDEYDIIYLGRCFNIISYASYLRVQSHDICTDFSTLRVMEISVWKVKSSVPVLLRSCSVGQKYIFM